MAEKTFIPVQLRVSKRVSPLLFAHLTGTALGGESAGAETRRLAEEALFLRTHPILRALLPAASAKEPLAQPLTVAPEVRTPGATGSLTPSAPVSTQPAAERRSTTPKAPPEQEGAPRAASQGGSGDGGSAMAAALVRRGLGTGPGRADR